MGEALRTEASGVGQRGLQFLAELGVEAGAADGLAMPAEGGQRLAGYPLAGALPPQTQHEFVVPGGHQILPQKPGGLLRAAAEKTARLGNVIDALESEAAVEGEKSTLEAADERPDFRALFIHDAAVPEKEGGAGPLFGGAGDALQGAGQQQIIRVEPANQVPVRERESLVDSGGGATVRLADADVDQIRVPVQDRVCLVG